MSVLAYASETNAAIIAAGAAIVGVVVGGVVSFLTTLAQNRHARKEREAAEATARRARAGEILGRVRTFLTDIEPERIGFNVNDETPDLLRDYSFRLNTLRDELSVFSAAAEDDRVMSRTADLEVALFNAFNRVGWHVRDLLGSAPSSLDSYNVAKRDHLRATVLVRIVLDLVRGRDVAELEAQLQRLDDETTP